MKKTYTESSFTYFSNECTRVDVGNINNNNNSKTNYPASNHVFVESPSNCACSHYPLRLDWFVTRRHQQAQDCLSEKQHEVLLHSLSYFIYFIYYLRVIYDLFICLITNEPSWSGDPAQRPRPDEQTLSRANI